MSMRYQRTMCGVLSGVMMMTPAFTGTSVSVHAEEAKAGVPIASYDFNGTIGEGTSAIITGLKNYDGQVVYGTGRSGKENDQAVQLGDYGLKLNHQNVGEDYTVSLWVKPDKTIPTNMPVLFLGYHNPEQWVAVSGDDSATYKVWSNEASNDSFNWKTVTTVDMPVGEWSMLTLTQSGNELSSYINGTLIGTGTASKALAGENQDIYLGVSNWDPEFTGLVDDAQVYDSVLSATEVRKLYDGKSAADIFAEEGFTVTEALNVLEGATSKLKVSMSSVIDNAVTTFASEDASIASVDENGEVTGVKAGETSITTTVKVGEMEKTKTTKVTVTKPAGEVNKELAVEYSMAGSVDGKLQDISGHGNDATIHNPDTVTFTTEDGKSIMNITDAKSYLDLPMGIMDALTDQEEFTVEATYARSTKAGGTSWLFCFGSNPKSTGTNYMFYCPYFSFGSGQVRAGIKDDSNEQLFSTGIQNENDKYYTVNMVFSKGTIELYLNGVKVGGELNSGYSIMDDVIANGTKDNILGYIGKSCWAQDTNFVGKISSFKIYNKAMTDEDVQKSDPSYQQAIQDNLDKNVTEKDIIGTKNTSASEVSYDLVLPSTLDEMEMTWVSSNPDVISNTGKVMNGTTDTTVTLTATVTSGILTATKEFTVTVKALDKSALEGSIKDAKELAASSYITEESKTALNKAIEKADAVSSQSEISTAISAIKKAMSRVSYKAEYKDPFQFIEGKEPVEKKELKVKETASLFTLPASIKDMVTVSYSSSNDAVAQYANGVVTAKKAGYALVTVTVTAKSDGFAMEYKTLVTVKETVAVTPAIDLSKVTAKAAATKLAKGSTTKITVSYPAAIKAAKPTITYKASGAVKVSTKGKVTAVKAGTGTVKVTVKANGKSVTKTITIKVGDISGSSTVKVKKSVTLKVKGLTGNVKWSVNKSSLAKISSKGKLTAKKKGTVVVTAKVSGVTMKKTIKIK